MNAIMIARSYLRTKPRAKVQPDRIFGVDLYPFQGARLLNRHAYALNETRAQLVAAGIDPDSLSRCAIRIGA